MAFMASTIWVTLGGTRTAAGVATTDHVVPGTVTWASSSNNVQISPSFDTLSAELSLIAVPPNALPITISVTAITVGGHTVTGSVNVTFSDSPPTTVDVVAQMQPNPV